MSSDIRVDNTLAPLEISCYICGEDIKETDKRQVILVAVNFVSGYTITYTPAHLSCVLEREHS